jgi:fatty-acyl-CoA synthase
VRGPIVMLGYWRRPEETAASRIDGWHRTGDLGVMDEEGFVTLVGRLKELYISGGENVYPAEVERVLAQHRSVSEVAVVGVPDPRWGEVGRAYVVPAGAPFDPAELLAWAGERLARYKLPREVVIVAELPRTASGKVQKHALLSSQ